MDGWIMGVIVLYYSTSDNNTSTSTSTYSRTSSRKQTRCSRKNRTPRQPRYKGQKSRKSTQSIPSLSLTGQKDGNRKSPLQKHKQRNHGLEPKLVHTLCFSKELHEPRVIPHSQCVLLYNPKNENIMDVVIPDKIPSVDRTTNETLAAFSIFLFVLLV